MKTPLSCARGSSLALLLGFLTAPFVALAQMSYDPPTATGFRSDFFPPRDSSLDGAGPAQYPGTPVVARNVRFHSPSTSKPSPSSGQTAIVNLGMTFSADVSSNGGASFNRVTGPAEAALRNVHAGPVAGGGTLYETEMLQLNVAGGTLPPGVRIRESPTLASIGQTTITPQPGEHFRIDSSFDIFTELSLDGGATWVASAAPLHVEMHRLVPEVRVDVAAYPPPDRLVETIGTEAATYPPLDAVVDELELEIEMPSRTLADAAAQPPIAGHVEEATFDLSLDGGATQERVTGSGDLAMRIMAMAPNGTHHQVEMLSMNLTADYNGGGGGTLMIRESPTRASLGRTSVRDVQGGAMISGFFDVFTEISLDGGVTWALAIKPIRIELKRSIPENSFATNFFPPRNGQFVVDRDPPVLFGNGMLVRNLRHSGFQQSAPLPEPGTSATITSTHTASFEMSTDGGATWQARQATAVMAMACTAGAHDTMELETISLNISGGNLPGGVRLRENPSLKSVGGLESETEVVEFRIGGFFDIFTEITTDNGATWFPADKPAHVQLGLVPPQDFYSSNFLPLRATFSNIDEAPDGEERFVGDHTPIIRGGRLTGSGPNGQGLRVAPPAPGATATYSFFGGYAGDLSLDGGATFVPISAPASVTMRATGVAGSTQTFDTEMLQRDIQGGTLPPGVMIRESPTRASTGRMTIVPVDGGFRIASFFDVFTEISVDGGATWLPAVQRVRHAARADAEPVVGTDSLVPPLADYAMAPGGTGVQVNLPPSPPEPQGVSINFTKIQIENKPQRLERQLPPLAPGGSVQTDSIVKYEWDFDYNGAAMHQSGDAEVVVRYTLTDSTGDVVDLAAEMLSLEFLGSGPIRIRESPTRPSLGRTSLRPLPGGTYSIESFFDVFVEVSIDSGLTWRPGDAPLGLRVLPTVNKVTLEAESLARAETVSNAAGMRGRTYPSGGGAGKVSMQDFHFVRQPQSYSLPEVGDEVLVTFLAGGRLDLVLADGSHISGECSFGHVVLIGHDYDEADGTRHFEMEMTSLDVSGGTLPPTVMIRESPTLRSTGRLISNPLPNGTWRIGSFFDVFTELSLDGGATWTPSDGPMRIGAAPVAPAVPLDSAHFATTDFFPPPGTFAIGDMLFPDGSSITGMTFTPAPGSPRVPLPAAGLFFDRYEEGRITFVFTNPLGVVTHVAVGATLGLRVTGPAAGADRSFDTELLSLSLHGSPPGVPNLRLRESPTRPSTGATRITETDGGFMVSSFFDVFTELSLDGGATWQSAAGSSHTELEATLPIVGVATNFYPPRHGVLGSLRNAASLVFGTGQHMHVRNLRLAGFTNNAPLVEVAGVTTDIEIPHTAEFELSFDGGATWQPQSAPATGNVRVAAGDVNGDGVFDTEMLQLNISGGTLPAGVHLRESPTRASLGQTFHNGDIPTQERMSGSFDVFLELSVDGGATWLPAAKPESIVLDNGPRRDFHPSNFLPLAGITAMDDWEAPVTFINRPAIRNFTCEFVDGRRLPPPVTGTRIDSWASIVEFQYSPDGGTTFTPVTAPATVTVRVTNIGNVTDTFNTEILALEIQGGTLPAGVRLRESPSRQSLGRMTIDPVDGGFRIGSFFDVFTEISLDGGGSWSPSTDTMHLEERLKSLGLLNNRDSFLARGRFSTQPGGIEPLANGVYVEEISFAPIFDQGIPLPAMGGAPVTATIPVEYTAVWRQDFGQVKADRHTDVRIIITPRDQFGNVRTFDTQMFITYLSGGGGAGGTISLRTSPIRPSLGQLTVESLSDGTYRVEAFFDIFTELSTDGGLTWAPTDAPLRAMLLPAIQKIREAAKQTARHARVSAAADGRGLTYAAGAAGGAGGRIGFFDVFCDVTNMLPPAGSTATGNFGGKGQLRLGAGGPGSTIHGVDVKLGAVMRHDSDDDGVSTYDTEVLQLEITGATLPAGMMFRESPTLRSTGRTAARHLPNGNWRTDSFFDVFTELSLDGGATWQPSDGAMRLDFDGHSQFVVTGPDQGSEPQVQTFDAPYFAPGLVFLAFPPSFTGGVRVAAGDVDGDGRADIITGAGAGGGPHVKVFSGVDNRPIRSFLAFEPAFTGGVNVGGGDVDGDGRAEIVVAAGAGGGPHVKVFSGSTGQVVQSFLAYDGAFTGGVNIATGDVTGDGFADLITGVGAGAGPHVKVFDGRTLALLHSFFAFGPAFTGGVFVAAGDVNGDGRADIVCGAGAGGAPHVRVFDGGSLVELHSFLAYPSGFAGGVRVAAGDVNGDGRADIITGAGPGGGPHVKVFDGRNGAAIESFFADPPSMDGIFVAGSPVGPRFPTAPPDLDGDGLLDVWEHAYFGRIDTGTFDTDSDGDGLSDGLELGLGSNPLAPDSFGQGAVTVEGGYLTMTLQRQPGMLYEIETARRLLPGQPDSFSPATTTILIDTPALLKVRDNFRIGTPPSRFIRAQVIGAP